MNETVATIKKLLTRRRPRCEFDELCMETSDGYSREHKKELCNGHRKFLLNQEQKRRRRAAHNVQGEPVSGDDNAL